MVGDRLGAHPAHFRQRPVAAVGEVFQCHPNASALVLVGAADAVAAVGSDADIVPAPVAVRIEVGEFGDGRSSGAW